MKASFEIDRDSKGEFFLRFKSGNSEIVFFGQGCKNKSSLKRTIGNIKKNAADAPVIDLTAIINRGDWPGADATNSQSNISHVKK